jgi:hypothetical protein
MRTINRVVRIVIAVIIAVLFFTGQITSYMGIILSIFLLTSLVNFCPLYILVGIKTCKIDKQ